MLNIAGKAFTVHAASASERNLYFPVSASAEEIHAIVKSAGRRVFFKNSQANQISHLCQQTHAAYRPQCTLYWASLQRVE